MIGFSIMMWFVALILLIVGISLLKGNHSSMHGKVYRETENKETFAKATGKPVVGIAIGICATGIIAIAIPDVYAIYGALVCIILTAGIGGVWLYKVNTHFSK